MLTSLFGDLPPPRLPTNQPAGLPPGSPAQPPTQASLSKDLLVDTSPAAAMRAQFAVHRADLQQASAMVTLIDPSRLWASQVVHALADAAGQPVQRLHLRERTTLRTLATVERTLVPRRGAQPLRVYQADIRASALEYGLAQEEITTALAEGSQLTAVIVGAMQPHALVALLRQLLQATRQAEWRCTELVFLLPPGAAALGQRIAEQPWPAHVHTHALAEPLSCAAQVWNTVLQAWEATQADQGFDLPPERSPEPAPDFLRAAVPAGPPAPWAAALALGEARRPAPAAMPASLARLLLPLARSEGLLACGIVDLGRGDLLASQQCTAPGTSPDTAPGTDLAALALALCAARQAHQAVSPGPALADEILITTGARQTLLRRLAQPPGNESRQGQAGLGFVAVLDRQQANLALLRFKLLDADRLLA